MATHLRKHHATLDKAGWQADPTDALIWQADQPASSDGPSTAGHASATPIADPKHITSNGDDCVSWCPACRVEFKRIQDAERKALASAPPLVRHVTREMAERVYRVSGELARDKHWTAYAVWLQSLAAAIEAQVAADDAREGK